MNKKVILIGFGSEIGSMLLFMNNPTKDNFIIDTVITNYIVNSSYSPIESLRARIIMANPSVIDKVKIVDSNCLSVNKRKIKIIWGNLNNLDLKSLKKKNFFAAIIATSKKDISNLKTIKKIQTISKYVFGVAESKIIPSYYNNIRDNINSLSRCRQITKETYFALGSCQSTGWTSQINCFLDLMKFNKVTDFKIHSNQLEIVHPDTPTGRLGTKSIDPRMQDARDNLRPSFSQATITMDKIFPNSKNINTISLRTLTMPPGFQICRIFFSYNAKKRITKKMIVNSFKKTEKKNKNVVMLSNDSLGSKAYEAVDSSSVILINDKYLNFYDNFFNSQNKKISLLILLSYVHNTRGYCRYVLESLKSFTKNEKKFFFN